MENKKVYETEYIEQTEMAALGYNLSEEEKKEVERALRSISEILADPNPPKSLWVWDEEEHEYYTILDEDESIEAGAENLIQATRISTKEVDRWVAAVVDGGYW